MDVVVRSNGAEWTQAEATVVETRHNKAFLVDSILAAGGVSYWCV
jgi:protein associated with RNAse G/E